MPTHEETDPVKSTHTPPNYAIALNADALEPWAATADPGPVDVRLSLARGWDDLLSEVRSIPGFEAFLRPPSYQDLLEAAAYGPVVTVNVSEWRCDALVLTSAGVEAVPLPDLTLRDAERRLERHLEVLASFDRSVTAYEASDIAFHRDTSDRAAMRARQEAGARRREATADLDRELTELVGWLWDVVVLPLLDKLPEPMSDGVRPRVWWCPTGPLAFLPIHAAGRDTVWLHDRVVSSMTPTVRSLLEARVEHRRSVRAPASCDIVRLSNDRRRFLVVSTFSSTDDLLTGPLSRLTATDVVECSDLYGVRTNLETCDFVHFDCHGDQVMSDPSQGGVQLTDGVLRVFDVAAMSTTGEFAGLAACKTAVGGVELLDESVTLSAALHYAGFRHVVGTLWNLAEPVARSAFANMYERLVTDDGTFDATESARELAHAVDQLRARGENLHSWASLVHIGP